MLGIDPQTIKAFGQIAGIGGLSLFVFVYLFKEVIRKKIFPQLTPDHAYRLIRLFLFLVFSFSSSGLAAWVFVSRKDTPPPPPPLVMPSEESHPIILGWIKKIDERDYVGAYKIGDELMIKKNLTLARFTDLTKSARDPLGDPIERINIKSGVLASPQGYPEGYYSYSFFRTRFSNGATFFENVYLRGVNGRWKPCSYEIFPAPA